MPNHVTTRIKAAPEVIKSMLNQGGNVDFSVLIPWQGSFEWDGVSAAAEICAEAALNLPLSENSLLARLQDSNRQRSSVKDLPEECFEQFVQMLRNHRATGFMHSMAFAREKWGTEWNAYSQKVEADNGEAKFDTAWNCPVPVLVQLSSNHPDHLIEVDFADEDIGSNCGTLHLKAGECVHQNEAGPWEEMTEDQRTAWGAFAYEVKGWTPDEDEAD